MALKIDLDPMGPGRARLMIGGPRQAPEAVSLAIQRNDGRYLGADRQWQVAPHWHPLFSAEPTADGLRLEIGPDLVDSLIEAGGAPLRVVARLDGVEDAGVLRLRGALIGSPARAPRQPAPPDETPSGQPEIAPADRDSSLEPEETVGAATGPLAPPPRRRWPWAVLAIAVLLGAGGIGAWRLGLLGSAAPEAGPDRPSGSAGPPVPEPGTPTQPEPAPEDAPEPKGIALARAFLAGRPGPEATFARAEQAEQAGDCPAAYALYSEAANADPGLAARLARRYDPLTHAAGPCIAAPDIPYAIVYYADAAAAGDAAVQRRLGRLMAEREPSGPTREAGLQWLRKAAAAGDEEARRILDGLGGR